MKVGAIPCVFWGIFADEETVPEGKLARKAATPHVTCGFATPCPADLIGLNCNAVVEGYGCNGKNEGVSVALPPWLAERYARDEAAHMTLSTAEGGEPKDTAWIDFSGRKYAGTAIRGKIGYRGFDGNDHFE